MHIIAENAGALQVLAATPFVGELELQDLLEEYPGLVLASAPDDQSVDIWTIGREVGVRSGSIDLVLLDSTGLVWVVEVKLAKNPEVRKQVVGQVLAYCADVARWTADDLVAYADQYLATQGSSFDEVVTSQHHDPTALVERASSRLAKGDLMAMVVVDELNAVLHGTVDFVNENAEFGLLAMKVEVIPHAGTRLFIPTVVGLAQRDRATSRQRTPTFRHALGEAPEAVLRAWDRIQSLAESEGWEVDEKQRIAEVRTAAGGAVLWFSPHHQEAQFFLGHLVRDGRETEAASVRELLDAVAGAPVTRRSPVVAADAITARWDAFTCAAQLMASVLDSKSA